jgi:hypothetical protein
MRQNEPAFDRLPAKAGKRHVEHVHKLEPGLNRREGRIEWMLARVIQPGLPKGIEIRWFIPRGQIGFELVKRQVE